jgi:hypothetical protein
MVESPGCLNLNSLNTARVTYFEDLHAIGYPYDPTVYAAGYPTGNPTGYEQDILHYPERQPFACPHMSK